MEDAESIIRGEHRNLATVLNCIASVVHDVEERGVAPDFALLRLAVDYVDTFLYTFHHPKETDHLFAALRRRAPSLAAELDELEAQHRQGRTMVDALGAALDAYELGGEDGHRGFKQAAEAFHRYEWSHMLKEEKSILPFARGCLTAADWDKIDAVFRDYQDPVFGARRKQEFDALYDRIVSLGPVCVTARGDPSAER
ncbi:MAG: hemerythrin domain-containing protein [Rhodospirillales bacterium]